MKNFTYSVPTTIHFGEGQISHLSELKASGKKVLYVYGGGSIKKTGLYDKSMQILKDAGLEVFELSGVEPNPKIETVRKGADLCKEQQIDMVLAVGGGSTCDCAKVIAAAACYEGDAWALVLNPPLIQKALPIYAVITLAATGSEMDAFAVISDLGKNEKWCTASPLLKPKMSIMDPTFTYSVSKRQTSAGTADIMSHTLENYFTSVKGSYLQARLCEAVLKTLIHYGPIALENPEDYEARANLMWCSSLAINGLLSNGADVAWCVHPMEHELSAFYDITHGEGLAILTPHFLEYTLNKDTLWKYVTYAEEVFGIREGSDEEKAKAAIQATKDFFKKMNLPQTLKDVGIDDKYLSIMAEKASKNAKNAFIPLEKQDLEAIFRAAL